jgi:hypothetical protein
VAGFFSKLLGRHLANVLTDLKRLGPVSSQKGRNGGYILSRPPAEINLLALYQGLAGSSRSQASNGVDSPRQLAATSEAPTDAPTNRGGSMAADRWLSPIERRWCQELASPSLSGLEQ